MLKSSSSTSSLSKKGSGKRNLKPISNKTWKSKKESEYQGPIDWSCYGLKIKYRGEHEREEAYRLWKYSQTAADDALAESNLILPVVKIERHPFHVLYHRRIYEENLLASNRTKARLLMKRFVFDVNEVWVTNLQHLREHQPEHLYTTSIPSKYNGDNNTVGDEIGENAQRGNGLKNRRDVKALLCMESQVPSVSQKRSFEKAYHTARMPDVKVVLDYKPTPTPVLDGIKLLPPTKESLVSGVGITERGVDFHDLTDVTVEGFPLRLHIDRLLPSNDYQGTIQPDVLWRFALHRGEDATRRLFVASEAAIASFVATVITDRSNWASQGITGNGLHDESTRPPPVLLLSRVVFQSEFNLPLRGVRTTGDISLLASITISVLAFGSSQSADAAASAESIEELSSLVTSIKIEICARILTPKGDEIRKSDNEYEQELFLELCPSELRYLLGQQSIPLHKLEWWLRPAPSEAEADQVIDMSNPSVAIESCHIWFQVLDALVIERTNVVSFSAAATDMSDSNLVFSLVVSHDAQISPISRVDGALSSLQALSCAYELLEILHTGEKTDEKIPILKVIGAAPDLFLSLENDGQYEADLEPPSILFSNTSDSAVPAMLPIAPKPVPAQIEPIKGGGAAGATSRLKAAAAAPKSTYVPSQASQTGTSDLAVGEEGTAAAMAAKRAEEKAAAALAAIVRKEEQAKAKAALTRRLHAGIWEATIDSGYNLSLRSAGLVSVVATVPGACEIGKCGLWYPDMNTSPKEYTQASARFFRDSRLSSTDSVLVNITYALDTSLLFPKLIAWENFSSYPTPCPFEEAEGGTAISMMTCRPIALLTTPLENAIDTRYAHTVMIMSAIPLEGVDYEPVDRYRAKKSGIKRPYGYCRHLVARNELGLREQVTVTLLGVDPVVSTSVFGITRLGAQPNNTDVNARNIWHNTLAITEHINRPRSPKDMHYILAKINTCGANIPTYYTTRMKGQEMVGLRSSNMVEFEDKYKDIQELRDAFNNQLALDAKIEKVSKDIKLKEQSAHILMRNEMQRAYEKKLRKATKSEAGWKQRYRASSLLEIQDNWERRRDDRNGLVFFHKLLPTSHGKRQQDTMPYQVDGMEDPQVLAKAMSQRERLSETCQWEVPTSWDGDPLNVHARHQNRSRHNSATSSAMETPAVLNGRGNGTGGDNHGINNNNNDDVSDFGDQDGDGLDEFFQDYNQQLVHKDRLGRVVNGNGANQGHSLSASAFDQPPDNWRPMGGATLPTTGNLTIRSDARNSDTSSVSLVESRAATIDTVNLEHIAEQLVSSDELMRVLAKRLGLPETQVVAADDLSSVFSITSIRSQRLKGGQQDNSATDDRQFPLAPRDNWIDDLHEPEFDSDEDLWSDEEDEAGDADIDRELADMDNMPTSHAENTAMRKRLWREQHGKVQSSVPSSVPFLQLPTPGAPTKNIEDGGVAATNAETREEIFGWRRLPRPDIAHGTFLSNALKTHTRGPDSLSSNTLNKPLFLTPISPVDACKYIPEDFTGAIESIFVPDARKDMERSIATMERNIRREKELMRNLPTDDLLLFGEAKEFTSAENFMAKQYQNDKDAVQDPKERAIENAILAAKSSNISMMEDALAEDIPINVADAFGNTLLILSAQQGSRRMCKFLLRRGADVNRQSLTGNTALHYCYAYSQHSLADYLKKKGADDSVVNVHGMTCYEGLSPDDLNDSDEDEEYQEGNDEGGDYDGDDDDYEDGSGEYS